MTLWFRPSRSIIECRQFDNLREIPGKGRNLWRDEGVICQSRFQKVECIEGGELSRELREIVSSTWSASKRYGMKNLRNGSHRQVSYG